MSSSPEGLAQLEAMVKRYRNSPSIILWSIGNEEGQLQDPMAEAGRQDRRHHGGPLPRARPHPRGFRRRQRRQREGRLRRVRHHRIQLQPAVSRPLSQGASRRGPLRLGDLERHLHPRRVHHRSAAQHCELLRRRRAAGAKQPEEWWTFYGTREWEAGGFAWTGFDYRGEPTPYGWPSINSQFGIVDMCGFPRTTFYYYKAWWGKEPIAASVSALELRGQGRRRDSGVGLLQSR